MSVSSVPPTITKPPGDVEAEQGNVVSLACEADGLPKPEYKFYKVRISYCKL